MGERVTIIGDGAMATVCSLLLSQGGHDVTLWGAFEDAINRLIQNRENQRFLPGVRLPPTVSLVMILRLVKSAITCNTARTSTFWKLSDSFSP